MEKPNALMIALGGKMPGPPKKGESDESADIRMTASRDIGRAVRERDDESLADALDRFLDSRNTGGSEESEEKE